MSVRRYVEEPGRLSHSSLSTYSECGERWRLERLYGVRSSTWFATVAGSAVHEITEAIDLRDLGLYEGGIPSFKDKFDALLVEESLKEITVKPSGKKLVNFGHNGGPNKKDYDWWLKFGPKYVEAWCDWRVRTGWSIAVLDGKPAIELPLTAPMGGDTRLGMIDRVFVRPGEGGEDEYIIVDLKTGNDPDSNLQLGDYRVGLLREYGIDVSVGAYWSASKGDLVTEVDLTVFSTSYVDAQYEMAWRGIRSGIFLANPSGNCRACDGAPFCRAIGGRRALEFPTRTVVTDRVVSEGVVPSEPGV